MTSDSAAPPTTPDTAPPRTPSPVHKLGREDLPKFALAIVIGTAGGAIFSYLDMPLPWMMGAMFATGMTTLGGVQLKMDSRLRMLMILVLGVLLGGAFSPEILERIPRWPITLASLAAYVGVATIATFFYYRIVARFDPRTAFFCAVPGGLNEMIILGENAGADERQISVSHTTRIFFVVMVLPFFFRLFGDLGTTVRTFASGDAGAIGTNDMLILTGCAVVGFYAARFLRIPAPHITGPMIASAAVHLAGFTEASPPAVVVAIAQVILGASVGARFAGLTFRDLGRIVRLGGFATLLLLTITVLFALALGAIAGFPFSSLVLAFSPGGLVEMSLIALTLDIDTAFVATHHIARISIVVIVVPIIFRLLVRFGLIGPGP
ncbi:MAG: AbrB family transcriptional regulator [Alphaproteobacteria bacterium]|nr:AbrB family transcriptional regulator [Alphaproteobacteria bacterium]